MTVTEVLEDGPLTAQEVAARIEESIEATYARLVSAETRGDVRVVITWADGITHRQWELM